MEITKEFIEQKKKEFPGCEFAKLTLKGKDEKDALTTLVRSPDRKTIGEADKWEQTNPDKAKAIYVRNCVLTDMEQIMADDNLFFQAYFGVIELLPFQKPGIERV